MNIGKAIAKCRNDRKWSQQSLGNKFKRIKTAPEISRWERNEVQPSGNHLRELLDIFGDPFRELILSVDRQTSQAKKGE